MIIDERNFGEVVEKALRLAGEYSKVGRPDTRGIIFDKERGTMRIIALYFFVEVSNLDIRIDIPTDRPFYDIFLKQWMSVPIKQNIDAMVERRRESEKYEFVGMTKYYASNILNIISKEMDKVMDAKSRYIFVQGFLPQGCAAVKFHEENGRPVYRIPGFNKEFVISQHSAIQEKYIVPGVTYACAISDCGNIIELDVISKFGKTKSGMLVSEIKYDSKCLPRLNNLEMIPDEFTVCSDSFSSKVMSDGSHITMPPIHIHSMMLYDILKLFLIPTSSAFNLHFQEEINADVWLESIPSDENDAKVDVWLCPLDYYKNIQRG